jgi:hypothetical protein
MTLPCMEALELRYIALGYEYFQLVSFDIQNDFTVHGGIFLSTSYLRWKRIVRDLFFEYTRTTEEKHTEIWKFPRFLQVFLSK